MWCSGEYIFIIAHTSRSPLPFHRWVVRVTFPTWLFLQPPLSSRFPFSLPSHCYFSLMESPHSSLRLSFYQRFYFHSSLFLFQIFGILLITFCHFHFYSFHYTDILCISPILLGLCYMLMEMMSMGVKRGGKQIIHTDDRKIRIRMLFVFGLCIV